MASGFYYRNSYQNVVVAEGTWVDVDFPEIDMADLELAYPLVVAEIVKRLYTDTPVWARRMFDLVRLWRENPVTGSPPTAPSTYSQEVVL